MKRLKQHWSARPLSGLLAVIYALVPVMLFALSGTSPLRAQGTTRSAPPSFAVLDLVNSSGYGGAEVGRQAADAFVVELGKTNSYEVLDRQSTLKGIQDQGLTVPLDTIGLQKLGRSLQVTGVVTGEVAAVSFSSNPRQATVSLLLRVTDPLTGELINGAIAQGTSNGRAVSASDDDALVNQAIDNAAFAAVRQIRSFNLPKATILNSRDADTVLLNQGTRSGLSDGLNMVVTRNGQEVGRIRVSNADSDQSDAFVTNRGIGIQPGDRATAIYALPAYTISAGALHTDSGNISSEGARSKSKRGNFSGIGGILVAILAGALLLSLIKRGGGSGSVGGAEVGKPLAVAGRADSLGGGGGLNPTLFTLVGDPLPSDYVPVVVKITATTGNINIQEFLEYHVYRSDNPNSLAIGLSIDLTGAVVSAPPALFGQVPLLVDTTQGPLTIFDDPNPKGFYTVSKPITGSSGTGGTTTTNTGTTGNTGGGTNATGLQTYTVAGVVPGSGLVIGNRYQYFIEGLYIQPGTGTGPSPVGNNGGSTTNSSTTNSNTNTTSTGSTTSGVSGHAPFYRLTSRRTTNFVTVIEPVLLTFTNVVPTPSTAVTLDNINVNVPSTRGADDYILQIANNIGFQNAKTFRPSSTGPYSFPTPAGMTYNPRNGAVPVSFSLQNNADLANTFANASTLYFRVGARDSRNGSGTSDSPNSYVYSDPVIAPVNTNTTALSNIKKRK